MFDSISTSSPLSYESGAVICIHIILRVDSLHKESTLNVRLN